MAITAPLLGVVHCAIRPGKKLVRIRRVVGIERDADADAETQSIHFERRSDGLGDPFDDQLRLIVTAVTAQQYDEFVPTKARYGIDRASRGLQPPRRLAQHGVAGRVAMKVVDWLESVEIDETEPAGAAIAACDCNCLFDAIVQQRPVGESSQRVLEREPPQSSLASHPWGDIC